MCIFYYSVYADALLWFQQGRIVYASMFIGFCCKGSLQFSWIKSFSKKKWLSASENVPLYHCTISISDLMVRKRWWGISIYYLYYILYYNIIYNIKYKSLLGRGAKRKYQMVQWYNGTLSGDRGSQSMHNVGCYRRCYGSKVRRIVLSAIEP